LRNLYQLSEPSDIDALNDKKTVRERYNTLGGSHYDLRYEEEQLSKYKAILDKLCYAKLTLDNGCGTGLLLPLLKQYVVGLDISAELIAAARKRAKNHHLLLGDSEYLPLRDRVFDSVVSITVIQNLSEPKRLVEESIRVTRPGSTIIISSHKRIYTKKEIRNLVENEQMIIEKVFTHENINDWVVVSTRK